VLTRASAKWDGGYTIARRNANIADITPDSFRLLLQYLPTLRQNYGEIRLRLGRRRAARAPSARLFAARIARSRLLGDDRQRGVPRRLVRAPRRRLRLRKVRVARSERSGGEVRGERVAHPFEPRLDDPIDVAAECIRWEVATAIAGVVHEPNPSFIVPSVFDAAVAPAVAEAVRSAV